MVFQKGNNHLYKGKHLSDEHRKKIGLANKGKPNVMKGKKQSLELRLKNSKGHLGHLVSEETKKKISLALKGKTTWMKGKTHSQESRRKIGLKSIGRKSRLGYKVSEETKKKLSNINKGKLRLEKHPNWKGGCSYKDYSLDWNNDLKNNIRNRDNCTCMVCGCIQIKNKHDVHHIDYNKKNCNVDNLITLCRKCHMKTNENRNLWETYLKIKLNYLYAKKS